MTDNSEPIRIGPQKLRRIDSILRGRREDSREDFRLCFSAGYSRFCDLVVCECCSSKHDDCRDLLKTKLEKLTVRFSLNFWECKNNKDYSTDSIDVAYVTDSIEAAFDKLIREEILTFEPFAMSIDHEKLKSVKKQAVSIIVMKLVNERFMKKHEYYPTYA